MKYWRITISTDLGSHSYESNQRDRDVAVAVATKETIKHFGHTSPRIYNVQVVYLAVIGDHPCGEIPLIGD